VRFFLESKRQPVIATPSVLGYGALRVCPKMEIIQHVE
jgi:hypothetical protein